MEFKTGDIIKASMNKYPFIYHYGIVINIKGEVRIVHNYPNEKNKYGGSVLICTPEKFFATCKFIQIQRTNTSKERILNIVERYKARPFNLLVFNCEHFVFEIRDGTPSSPQVRQWIYNIISFLVIITTLLKKTLKSERFLLLSKVKSL